jgi:hypothetical protein
MSHFHITRCIDMPYLHMSVRTLNVELLDMSEPYQLLRQPYFQLEYRRRNFSGFGVDLIGI